MSRWTTRRRCAAAAARSTTMTIRPVRGRRAGASRPSRWIGSPSTCSIAGRGHPSGETLPQLTAGARCPGVEAKNEDLPLPREARHDFLRVHAALDELDGGVLPGLGHPPARPDRRRPSRRGRSRVRGARARASCRPPRSPGRALRATLPRGTRPGRRPASAGPDPIPPLPSRGGARLSPAGPRPAGRGDRGTGLSPAPGDPARRRGCGRLVVRGSGESLTPLRETSRLTGRLASMPPREHRLRSPASSRARPSGSTPPSASAVVSSESPAKNRHSTIQGPGMEARERLQRFLERERPVGIGRDASWRSSERDRRDTSTPLAGGPAPRFVHRGSGASRAPPRRRNASGRGTSPASGPRA